MHLDNCTAKAKRWKRPVEGNGKRGALEARAEGAEAQNRTERNNWSQDQATKKSSYKEHRVDAKAPYAEEGRGQLRKASGNCKQVTIRGYPNGGTQPG